MSSRKQTDMSNLSQDGNNAQSNNSPTSLKN
jgi:hypothetical protein